MNIDKLIDEVLEGKDPDTLSYDDVLGVTEPKRTGYRGPEGRLIDALMQRAEVDNKTPEQAAKDLGFEGEEDIIAYIKELQSRQFLHNPGKLKRISGPKRNVG